MRLHVSMMLVPAALLFAACDNGDERRVDDALRNDLALASQAQQYMPQQFVSPQEQAYANSYGYAPRPYAPQPIYAPAPARRASAPSRRAASTVYRVPAEQPTRVVKNTKRDAIIGAVAGGAIGAVTSRDRIKGAVIGAAAGGLLGAVIGNNVDKKRVPVPQN